MKWTYIIRLQYFLRHFVFYKLSSFYFFVNFTFLLILCEFFVFLLLWTLCQIQFSLLPIVILFSFLLKFICGNDNNGVSSLISLYIYIYIYIINFLACHFVYNTLFFLFFLCVQVLEMVYVDVHFFSFVKKRCCSGFYFQNHLCFSFIIPCKFFLFLFI